MGESAVVFITFSGRRGEIIQIHADFSLLFRACWIRSIGPAANPAAGVAYVGCCHIFFRLVFRPLVERDQMLRLPAISSLQRFARRKFARRDRARRNSLQARARTAITRAACIESMESRCLLSITPSLVPVAISSA